MKFPRYFLLPTLLLSAPALATQPLGAVTGSASSVNQSDNQDSQIALELTSNFTNNYPVTAQYSAVYNASAQMTQAYSGVTASWTSPDLGFVLLNWGWYSGNGGSGDNTSVSNIAVWQYSFKAKGNGTFSGSYDFQMINGDASGIDPIFLGGDWGSQVKGFGTGTFSVPLVNGQTYTFTLESSGGLTGSNGLDAVADAQALVEWQVNTTPGAVPEPASWALMIAGFGLTGTAMRRRRGAFAAA
ncbi:MAG: PEPxxWA-CTERM sorting domain-containing protein [Bacteroidota bacterium]